MKIAVKKKIKRRLLTILSRLMSPTFIVGAIDDRVFSEMLERHFAERGDSSGILVRLRAELLEGQLSEQTVEKGLNGALLHRKIENEYNKEMVDLLKDGFRSKKFEIKASIGDFYLEMLNSKLDSMPLGRSIISSETANKIFNGDNIQIMKNSIISDDSEIGDYTYIGYNCLISSSSIGRYCSVANNVSIGPGEHTLDTVSTHSVFLGDAYRTLTALPCAIGNDVWIGANSVIRRGVRIGNGAVVGANSFVNADVPDFAIVAGAPARLIKFRFDDAAQEVIRNSLWWDKDLDKARETIKELAASIGLSSDASLDAAPRVSKARGEGEIKL